MEVMKRLENHINIINLVGCCTQDNGPLYVIVEFAKHGNLRDFLKAQRVAASRDVQEEIHLTHGNLLSFSRQCARGMEYLAEQKV